MPYLKLDLESSQLSVSISLTAHLFHIVDQLSEWSVYCHKQYLDYFNATSEFTLIDRELLTKHKELRMRHNWGEGLEQTFYTDIDLDSALEEGVRIGYIFAEEARIEKEVFENFKSRITTIMNDNLAILHSFAERLQSEKDQLLEMVNTLSRFCMNYPVLVPVFLIASPHDRNGGGGYNGGVLTLEIPRAHDAYPMFLHELFHVFLNSQRELLEKIIKTEKITYQQLNEGIAYALSPGIFHSGEPDSDPLFEIVRRDEENQLSKNPLVVFRRYGLELRSTLREALRDDSQNLETFLPNAIEILRDKVQ
ncbi:hypothetical protein GH157_06065 [archaeon]|nr:hypothetical protein [archaeon]